MTPGEPLSFAANFTRVWLLTDFLRNCSDISDNVWDCCALFPTQKAFAHTDWLCCPLPPTFNKVYVEVFNIINPIIPPPSIHQHNTTKGLIIIKVCRVVFSTNKQTNKQITTISVFNKNFTLKQTKKQTNKKSNKQTNKQNYPPCPPPQDSDR